MKCKCFGSVRPETGQTRRIPVECEICDRVDLVRANRHGIYICAACHWDIMSPHIYD